MPSYFIMVSSLSPNKKISVLFLSLADNAFPPAIDPTVYSSLTSPVWKSSM